MSPNTPAAPAESAVALSGAPSTGRLAVLTAYAMGAALIPIPFVPDRVISRIRGALVHDVINRHGLSLTSDARTLLSEPQSDQRTRIVKAAETVVRQVLRRFWAIGAVDTVGRGVEVYALGLLFDRYLSRVRKAGTARIHAEEARRIRTAVDRSLLRALSPTLHPHAATEQAGLEDLRDEFTRWIDAVLLTSAALPSYLQRRLESAFDEIVIETPGLGDV